MQVEQLRHAEQGLGLFEDHMTFVRSLAFDLNVDETTLILLLVIALFSPDRDRLSDRELIAAQQERYVAPSGELKHIVISSFGRLLLYENNVEAISPSTTRLHLQGAEVNSEERQHW